MISDSLITGLVLLGVVYCLIRTRVAPENVLLFGLSMLIVCGVLSVEQAFSGFANEGVVTVAILYVVANSLLSSGAISQLARKILGNPSSTISAQLRLMVPVAFLSAFLNNTPMVAMSIPIVSEWCRRYQLSVSKLMMPLSYGAIVGGLCTLIGTSTNLVVNEMLFRSSGQRLAIFDLAWVGLPCTVAVIGATVFLSRWFLRDMSGRFSQFADVRQYIVEMQVPERSPLIDKSIEDAGLRALPGLFLAEVIREGKVISVIDPRWSLCAGDQLVFAGDVDSVVELKKIHGLSSAEHEVFKLSGNGSRTLVEVVVSKYHPLLGKTIKEGNFRENYGAVIIAISRNGEQLRGRIGDKRLSAGDTLLLETTPDFVEHQKYSRNFLVVSPLADFQPPDSRIRWLTLLSMVLMLGLVGSGLMSMFHAAFITVAILIVTRCTNFQDARRSVDDGVVVVIASSLGLGVAVEQSGLADIITSSVLSPVINSPILALAIIFLMTAVFSAIISNVAAAVLIFPIAEATAQLQNVALEPYAVAIMVAASTCFATPMGYQTNLMVAGPGGYRFTDFVKMGLPLTLIVWLISMAIIPQIWTF